MNQKLLEGLVDIIDRIDTLSDRIKPESLDDYRRYYAMVQKELALRSNYYAIGNNDGILVRPEFQEPIQPVPLLLFCPICHTKHVDVGEFATKSHHTHSCQGLLPNGRPCGLTWRPALVPTVGVDALPGFLDEPVGHGARFTGKAE